MKPILPCLLLITLVTPGCIRSVTSHQYLPSAANNGLVYSLPRTKLKATITYTVRKETRFVNGIPTVSTETVKISKPINLETIVGPDPFNTYVLSGEGLVKDARLDSSFKFSVADNNLLTSITSDALDKTPEILQGLVGSGISIAKMVAAAGLEQPSPLKQILARLASIDQEVAALTSSKDPKVVEKLDTLIKEQTVLLAYATKYRELNTPKFEDRDVVYSETFDLSELEYHSDRWSKDIKAPGIKFSSVISDNDVPNTRVEIFANELQHQNAITRYSVPADGEQGVLYRSSTPLRTKVTVSPNDDIVFNDFIPFTQVSPFNRLEARYKAFAKRKTTITFSTATGSPKEYGVEATSSAEAAAKALDSTLSKVQNVAADIERSNAAAAAAKKSPEQEAIAELEVQKKLIDSEAALIKARQELERIKAGAN